MDSSKLKNGPIVIQASGMEFSDGGNTIWVHSPLGGTILRIKCSGRIITDECQFSPNSHGDIMVSGDIHICVSDDIVSDEQMSRALENIVD